MLSYLLHLGLSYKWSRSFRFPNQNPVPISLLPHMCHMPRPSHPWFDHSNSIWWWIRIDEVLYNAGLLTLTSRPFLRHRLTTVIHTEDSANCLVEQITELDFVTLVFFYYKPLFLVFFSFLLFPSSSHSLILVHYHSMARRFTKPLTPKRSRVNSVKFFSRICLNVRSHLILVLPDCGFPLTLANTIHYSFLTPSIPATGLSVLAS